MHLHAHTGYIYVNFNKFCRKTFRISTILALSKMASKTPLEIILSIKYSMRNVSWHVKYLLNVQDCFTIWP